MPIPTQTEMYGIVLGLMGDGGEYTRRSMKQKALSYLDLTAEETLQKTDSGVLVYESRVGWAISYLSRAQLISRVNRGVYVINDEGKNTLKENLDPDALWYRLDDRIRTLDPWKTGVKKQRQQVAEDGKVVEPPAQSGAVSPQEQISSLASELDANLADELLALIMDHDSDFFERIVVQLLEKMGYGQGVVTRRSSDGGIDGLITTDELGFRPICTQAKRFSADNKVSRPMVQAFVGALNGAPNGVFITTSGFTSEAIDYASKYPNATLSLIDGTGSQS